MRRISKIFVVLIVCAALSNGLPTSSVSAAEEVITVGEHKFTVIDSELRHYEGPGGDIRIPEGITGSGFDTVAKTIYGSSVGVFAAIAYPGTIKSITFPETFTTIGPYFLYERGDIEEFTVPEQVTTIGDSAFRSLPNLKKLTINSLRLTTERSGNFAYNPSLESVIINSPLVTMNDEVYGSSAFSNCPNLKTIYFPGLTGFISASTFTNCASLTNIVIPEGVTGISGGTGTSANVFSGSGLKELILPPALTDLRVGVISGAQQLKNVAVLAARLDNLDIRTFVLAVASRRGPITQDPITIYAYPGTETFTQIHENNENLPSLPASLLNQTPDIHPKHTIKTLVRGAQVTVQNISGPGLAYGNEYPGVQTTVYWDAYRHDAEADDAGPDLEAGLAEDGYPSFETTVLDAWRTVTSGDAATASANPDRFIRNGADHPFADAGKTPLEDGDRVHFYNSSGRTLASWYDPDGEITALSTAPGVPVTLVLRNAAGEALSDIEVRLAPYNHNMWGVWEKIGDTDEKGQITLNFDGQGEYLVTPYGGAGQLVFNMLPVSASLPDIGIKTGAVTGDDFDPDIPLSSGQLGGVFIQMADGKAKDTGFDPAHFDYNIYVKSGTAKIAFPVSLNDGDKTETAFTAKLGDTAVGTDFGELELNLGSGSGPWTLTLTTELTEDGKDYKNEYVINIIRSETGGYAGIYKMEGALGLGIGKGTTLAKAFVPGIASYTAYVNPGQTEAVFNVTVANGAVFTFPQGGSAADEKNNGDGTASYRVTLSVPAPEGSAQAGDVAGTKTITTALGGKSVEHGIVFALRSPVSGVFTPDWVTEYEPASGQFINDDSSGLSALLAYTHYFKFVSLGGFGGYATYYYDEPITNDPNNPYGVDFIVYGNAFEGGMCNEPSGAWVSYDGNEWYYLAGQRHYELETTSKEAALRSGKTFKGPLVWSLGGYPEDVDWGYADVANSSESENAATRWNVDAKPWNPYRYRSIEGFEELPVSDPDYNAADIGNIGDMFDLSWAVDEHGKPVDLATALPGGIRYIRLQNVTDVSENGSFGEISPELGTITRVNPSYVTRNVGTTAAPKTFTVGGVDILNRADLRQIGRNTYYLPGFDLGGQAVFVHIEGNANDNIYVNREAYYGGEADYTGLCDGDLSRTVRVVIQNGDSEPRIYVVDCVNGGDPDVNADLLSVNINPDNVKLTQDSGGSYTGTVINEVTAVALNVRTINPETAINITGDGVDGTLDGAMGEAALNHGEFSNTVIGYTFPVKVGRNSFTVTTESKDGSNKKTYSVEITRRPPQYGVPQLDTGTGNSGNTAAGAVVSGSDLEDLTTAIASSDNAPKMADVSLAEAGTIKIDLAANGGDADSAIYDALRSGGPLEGLEGMLENGVIAVDGDGSIVANADAALGKMTSEERARYGKTAALPAVTAEVGAPSGSNYKTAALVYRDVFGEFTDAPAGGIDVFKLTTEDEIHHFELAQSLENILPGEFIITDGLGNKILPESELAGDELLIIAVEDNSDLDWNRDSGEIADPPIVAQKIDNGGNDPGGNDPGGNDPGGNDPSGGDGDDYTGDGSGGCDAGLGAAALISALGLCIGRKKSK